jgi:sporulation protein YlmC with PRC-barrel domain
VKREKPHQERDVTRAREKPAREPDMAREKPGRAEIAVERLVGRKVLALNGRAIGRIEEICAEPRGKALVVTEFHVGAYAAFESLAAASIGRTVLRLLRMRRKSGGYRVPWDQLDLADPARPRLRCPVGELKPLEGGV